MAKTPRKKTRKLAKRQPTPKKRPPQSAKKKRAKKVARPAPPPKPRQAVQPDPPQKRKVKLPFPLVGVDPAEPIKVGEDEDGEPITVTSALPKNWHRVTADTDNIDEGQPGKELTIREQLFVEAYLGRACKNAGRAAKMAGYQGNTDSLRSTGYQVLMRAHVQRAVGQALLAVRADRESLLAVALRNAQASLAPFFVPVLDQRGQMHHAMSITAGAEVGAMEWLKECTEDIGAAGIVSRKIKVVDKRPFLEFAAKLMHLYSDKFNVTLTNDAGMRRIEDMSPEDQQAEILKLLGEAAGDIANPRKDDAGTMPSAALDSEALAGKGPERVATPGETLTPTKPADDDLDIFGDADDGPAT